MRRAFLLFFLFMTWIVPAQEKPRLVVTQLKENFYELTSQVPYPVNFLAFVTAEGILLVDSGQEESGSEIKAALKTIAKGNDTVKYLINTHAHIDHCGGNLALAGEPVVMGTAILKTRLRSGSLVLKEFPDNALPQMVFSDSTTLEFGGESIRIIALPGAHDGSDVIVHFTKAGIVCLGDIAFGTTFPSVDGATGNMRKYPDIINKVLKLVPADAIFVTGHGRNMSYAELEKYRDMFVEAIHVVHVEMAKGRTLQEMQQDDILKDFKSFDGTMVNRNMMIYFIAIAGKNKMTGSTIEELYKVLVHEDAQAAVKKYRQLKKNYPEKYSFGEGPLIYVGYWLLKKERIKDAIEMFKLYVQEFPNAWNSYDCLGEAYLKAGDEVQALANYERSLQLNPNNQGAVETVKKLKADH
jgi:glyoxylase-like metal-dependent hydrolase (beta-lactamase superfamily II)